MLGAPIDGSGLPTGTLCLTFDDGPGITRQDGPGPRTPELAELLADHEVSATFFVCGTNVLDHPGVVARLLALGHAVGNHTYDHPNLVTHQAAGGDVRAQIATTDALIRAEGATGRLPFRPPYGAWSADVAAALEAADPELCERTLGPVMWDVDAQDWACWRHDVPVVEATARYLAAVADAGRGVVLMHDSTADDLALRAANQTYALVEALLPRLHERGYTFVPLASVSEGTATTGP